MDNIFSFRLDKETSTILRILAERTLRSRSGLVRLLIHTAALESGLISPSDSQPTAYTDDVNQTPVLVVGHREVRS